MNFRRILGNKKTSRKDIQELERLEGDVNEAMKHIEDYAQTGRKLFSIMKAFIPIVKRNKQVDYQYTDTLKSYYANLERENIAVFDVFTGRVKHFNFDNANDVAKTIILRNGTSLSRPENLRSGNRAIGQALLSDNTEVFCPADAMAYSLESIANTLLKDIRFFKIRIKETMS